MMKKRENRNKRRSEFRITKPIAFLVGGIILLLSFGSVLAVKDYIIKPLVLLTPTPTLTPTIIPTDTPTPTLTPTPIPTQKPQSSYSREQCLRDNEAKAMAFRKIVLSQGYSVEEADASYEMAKANGIQQCNSGNFTGSSKVNQNQSDRLDERLDKIERDIQNRKTWDLICGDRGYNSMTGSCN